MPQIKILIILSLILSPVSSAAKDLQKETAEYNQQGINALNKNEFIHAIDYFQRALQLIPDNETIKKNLAITYNNYAIALNNENKPEDAKEYLYKAIELEKDDLGFKENLANIISNLAIKYYNDGNYDSAIQELKESLASLPKHISSLMLLGQIYYQMQDLKKAQEVWEKAYTYDPHNIELKQMLAKLSSEEKVETQLKQLDAYYFDIRFDKEAIDTEIYDIRYYLQDAYREIGRDFNYYPQHKIPLILYTQEDFRRLRQTPDWVAGIYDGKIRLPVKNGNFPTEEFKRLIRHEYTHAVVFELSNGKCPIWFNEGLAKYEESKPEKPDLTPLKKAVNPVRGKASSGVKENALIPIAKLDYNFSLQTDPEKLNLAYLEAYSFIEFILNRWNFYIIKDILKHIKDGHIALVPKNRYSGTHPSPLPSPLRGEGVG